MESEFESNIELSVVIPMFNESENIDSTVNQIIKTFKDCGFNQKWELVLVNDGSNDNTLEIANRWKEKLSNLTIVSYEINMGRGKALKTGFHHAKGNYIISIDFDLSYSPEHIIKIYHELKNNPMTDAVLGSVYMAGGKAVNVPFFRLLISRLGNKILNKSFGGDFHTITCVLRGYKNNVINSIEIESNGKEIHLEILSKLHALGYRITEIPATLTSRKKGKSKFKFKSTSITHIVFAIFERPNLLFGFFGLALLGSGLYFGAIVVYERFFGDLNPERPLIDLTVMLVLSGILILSFGYIAMQNYALRKEIYRIQKKTKQIEKMLK